MLRYIRGSGTVYQRVKHTRFGTRVLKNLWIQYRDAKGQQIKESDGTTDRAEARRLLAIRRGEVAAGKLVSRGEGVTFSDLADLVISDYRANGKKSLDDTRRRFIKHLIPFFAEYRAHEITTDVVRTYIRERQEAGASNAIVNRELAALKRGFSLLAQADRLSKKPYIPKLEENNVRQGFFEQEDFKKLLDRLPDYLKPPVTFLLFWNGRTGVAPLSSPGRGNGSSTPMLLGGKLLKRLA